MMYLKQILNIICRLSILNCLFIILIEAKLIYTKLSTNDYSPHNINLNFSNEKVNINNYNRFSQFNNNNNNNTLSLTILSFRCGRSSQQSIENNNISSSLLYSNNISISTNKTNFDQLNEFNDNNKSSISSVNLISSNKNRSKSNLLKSIHNLFSSFSFKGIGFTISKSIVELSTFGCGIKLPITPNFPNYDSFVHLPRIGIYMGMIYPHCSARLNISVSLPIQTVIYLLVLILSPFLDNSSPKQFSSNHASRTNHVNSNKNLSKLKESNQKLKKNILLDNLKSLRKKLKATDSVRRVGFTLSYKYDRLNGLSYSIGPWIYYLPGMRIMNTILPYILFTPTVVITIAVLISRFFSLLGLNVVKNEKVKEAIIVPLRNETISVLNKNISSGVEYVNKKKINKINNTNNNNELETLVAKSNVNASNNIKYNKNCDLNIPIKSYDMFLKDCSNVYDYWKKTIDNWASTKSTGFAYNLGWYRSTKYTNPTHKIDYATSAMGSSVLFEVSPFYPFYDLMYFQPPPPHINTTITTSPSSYNVSDNNLNLFNMNSNNSSSILAR